MSRPSTWQCPRCFALHFSAEHVCKRCGAERPGPSVPVVHARRDSSLVVLQLPPVELPHARADRTVGRSAWLTPTLLLLFALAVVSQGDPLARRILHTSAVGGTSAAALQARREALTSATTRLIEVSQAMREGGDRTALQRNAQLIGRRYRLEGNHETALADLEVRARAAWLELVSLPPDAPTATAAARLRAVDGELSSLLEELSDVR